MRHLMLVIAGLFLVAASPAEEADQLIEQGKDKEALALIEKAVGQDSAEAIDYLAQLYDDGRLVEQDLVRAASLYRRAAEAGVAHAQWRLGVMLDMSEGVAENPEEAVGWFRKAMEQGDRTAIVSLAVMHAMGRGVDQDFAEAMRLYREAARRGEPHGFYGVGILYARGEGVAEDKTTALGWMMVAALLGDEQAKTLIEKEAFADADGHRAAALGNEVLAEFGHRDKLVKFRDLDAEKAQSRPK